MVMLSRLGNWTLVEDRWDLLAANWKRAPLAKRIILTDGRPAVLSKDGSVASTVPMPVWQVIRKRLKRTEDFHLIGTPKSRERVCEMCAASLQVSREYTHAWAFKCPVCKSVELHGKDKVGGVIGAGEEEKT